MSSLRSNNKMIESSTVPGTGVARSGMECRSARIRRLLVLKLGLGLSLESLYRRVLLAVVDDEVAAVEMRVGQGRHGGGGLFLGEELDEAETAVALAALLEGKANALELTVGGEQLAKFLRG